MALIDRRNTAAEELAKLTEQAETLITREGFDPESEQWTTLQSDLDARRADLQRMDGILDTSALTAARPIPGRDPDDWAGELLTAAREGRPSREALVTLERAYAVLTTTTPAFKADPVTLRPKPDDWKLLTPVVDASTVVNVNSNSYRYITMPSPLSAGAVAEAGKKLGVEFASTEVTGTLGKAAHILDVTQETLEDDPQARTILSQWLMDGVRRKIEADATTVLVGGSGYLTGSVTAVQGAAAGIRLGIALLQAQGLQANTAALNPTDWANLDMGIFNAAGSNSQTVMQSTVWGGVRLISVPALAAGTILVGDLKSTLLHIQRSTVSVDITDSGQSVETTPRDRFTYNLFGFRAEARYKTILQNPGATAKITVGP